MIIIFKKNIFELLEYFIKYFLVKSKNVKMFDVCCTVDRLFISLKFSYQGPITASET